VKTIMPYGAFVEIFPGTDGLLHVSELDWKRIERVEDVLKEGDVIEFQVVGKDPRTGKLKLSRRALLPKPEGYVEREPAMEGGGPDRGDARAGMTDRAVIGTVRAATGDRTTSRNARRPKVTGGLCRFPADSCDPMAVPAGPHAGIRVTAAPSATVQTPTQTPSSWHECVS
jgi:polyribonucleotide nucleotidyltransferase